MSYWVHVEDECPNCGHGNTYFEKNYTSNMSYMWNDAGAVLREWNGKKASECTPLLAEALDKIKANYAEYKKGEPDNGWGSVESAVAFLTGILRACRDNPDAKLSVSC